MIEDTDAVSPLDAATSQQLREQVERVLDSLDGREERVIRLRFGLDDGRQRTLEEVGREFGLTRERIRQIESMALRKLRHPSRSREAPGVRYGVSSGGEASQTSQRHHDGPSQMQRAVSDSRLSTVVSSRR